MSEQFAVTFCVHCQGGIEFDIANFQEGMVVVCPHCKRATTLSLPNDQRLPSPAMSPASRLPKILLRKNVIIATTTGAIISLVVIATFLDSSDEKAVSEAIAGLALGAVFLAGFLAVYFLPALVGRHKRNGGAIFVLNLLLGWTILGWIIALIWASTVDPEK